jgi:hypothetical protein
VTHVAVDVTTPLTVSGLDANSAKLSSASGSSSSNPAENPGSVVPDVPPSAQTANARAPTEVVAVVDPVEPWIEPVGIDALAVRCSGVTSTNAYSSTSSFSVAATSTLNAMLAGSEAPAIR